MAKIVLRLGNPFCRIMHVAIPEVPDCDFRPHKSMVSLVIDEQRSSRAIAGFALIRVQDELTHPGGAKPFAFEAEERQFRKGIQGPEIGIELEAVDNRRFGSHAYMFGTQVSVCVHDLVLSCTVLKHSGFPARDAHLIATYGLDQRGRQCILGPAKFPYAFRSRSLQLSHVLRRTQRNSLCLSVKSSQ